MIRQEKKQTLTLEKILLLIVTIACILVVLFTMMLQVWFTPKQRAERRLEELAREYYTIYLYPQATESGKKPAEIFANYSDTGMPATHLRQLLLYNNGAHQDELTMFQNDKYYCDTNSTGVKYYPKEPYGPQDYEMEFYYNCEELKK